MPPLILTVSLKHRNSKYVTQHNSDSGVCVLTMQNMKELNFFKEHIQDQKPNLTSSCIALASPLLFIWFFLQNPS